MEETKLICERLEKYVQELYPDTSRLSEQETKALRAMEPHINSLGQAMKRAATLQERVKALRDGLFNASAVLESRAANRLSENVKLLTYPSEWLLLWYLFEAIFAPIWSAVSKLCRALFPASNTASNVPHENLAPSCSGSGPQEVKEENTSENATAEALPAEDDAKPEDMTEDAKHPAIDHQTSDADPTPEFQATSGASEQDEFVGSIHTSTASGNLAHTPVVGSMSQPSNTSLPIPGLLRRHSRKAPDLEAGAGATDECERD
ncbi:hypothetical protein D6D12_10690 [Aureobasidium pullulans]|uniref:Uncharacterized protein n=1 Tax=Aureobasidium pullulans TaxID=5580 RepID=A0AB74JCP8_AURPU|nr:hypothetical protein D6D12_10690 [Aureobasidium pullulans]